VTRQQDLESTELRTYLRPNLADTATHSTSKSHVLIVMRQWVEQVQHSDNDFQNGLNPTRDIMISLVKSTTISCLQKIPLLAIVREKTVATSSTVHTKPK